MKISVKRSVRRSVRAAAVLLCLSLACLLLPAWAAAEGGEWRVALVTDYGDITDQSFKQA